MAPLSSSGRHQNMKILNNCSRFSTACPIELKILCCWYEPASSALSKLFMINTWTDDVMLCFYLLPLSYLRRTMHSTAPFLLKFKRHQLYLICSWVRGGHEWFNFRNVSDSSVPLVLFRVFSMPCLKGWGSSWNAVSILLLHFQSYYSDLPLNVNFTFAIGDFF